MLRKFLVDILGKLPRVRIERAPRHHEGDGHKDTYRVGDTVDVMPGRTFICVVAGERCLVSFEGLGGKAFLVPKP